MPENHTKQKAKRARQARMPEAGTQTRAVLASPLGEVGIPQVEAFLEEAKKEPKRILMTDYIDTIRVLRDEKRFTFRAIADWLTERGIETDHSAVYRAYLAAIPEENRNPDQDWSDVDQPE